MEQNYHDSSQYKISLLSLDSRFADVRSCTNGEWKITLPYPLKNVIRVRLASVEIPLVEYVFSEEYGNLTCAIKLGNNPNFAKMKPLTPGNYTADQLIISIQNNLQLIHSGFTVALDPITGRIRIENTSVKFQFYGVSFNKSVANQRSFWGLGYYLGFRDATVCAVEDPITGNWGIEAVSIISIQPNRYYLMNMWCPDSIINVQHRTEDGGFLNCFGKVILKDDMFTYIFDDNSNLVRKEFTGLAPFTVPFFKVELLNPYGRQIDMLDTNWSITIEITEVMNSRTYTKLLQNYERS
jgi:hypothetical protein